MLRQNDCPRLMQEQFGQAWPVRLLERKARMHSWTRMLHGILRPAMADWEPPAIAATELVPTPSPSQSRATAAAQQES